MPQRSRGVRPSPPDRAGEHQWEVEARGGAEWVSRPGRNGVFRWHRVVDRASEEQWRAQFKNPPPARFRVDAAGLRRLRKELARASVLVHAFGWRGVYSAPLFSDDIGGAWLRRRGAAASDGRPPQAVFYSNHSLYEASRRGVLLLECGVYSENRKQVAGIGRLLFGRRFKWPSGGSMRISMPRL